MTLFIVCESLVQMLSALLQHFWFILFDYENRLQSFTAGSLPVYSEFSNYTIFGIIEVITVQFDNWIRV